MKEIVKKLKKSIEYRSEHKKIIEEFKRAIKNYFLEKYDFHINVLTFVTHFAIEQNIPYYYRGEEIIHTDFKFTAKVLYDFCNDFECEFIETCCDGERYIFTFEDVDMSNAFIMG